MLKEGFADGGIIWEVGLGLDKTDTRGGDIAGCASVVIVPWRVRGGEIVEGTSLVGRVLGVVLD